METQNNANTSDSGGQADPPPAQTVREVHYPQKKSGGILKKFFISLLGLVFLVSIVMNVYLAAIIAQTYAGPLETVVLKDGTPEQTVAVYRVRGIIHAGSAAEFRRFFRTVEKNENIKAVVLRVESPGGTIGASDQIGEMVRRIRQSGRKVVVSMGSVAASGGYYISAPADYIMAESSTITGSIGVIAEWFVLKGTLDKIGAEPVVMKSSDASRWKDAMSMVHKPDELQRQHIQEILDASQAQFEKFVREGRGDRLEPNEVTLTWTDAETGKQRTRKETEPFNGKVYRTAEAIRLGLVDATGYEPDAIEKAAELAGLAEPRVVEYRMRQGVMGALLFGPQGKAPSPPDLSISPETLDRFRSPRLLMLWRAE